MNWFTILAAVGANGNSHRTTIGLKPYSVSANLKKRR
jgi:hypothetical protein